VSLAVGDRAPGFTLPDTAGEEHSLVAPAVVVFTCNHCPYALAWHDRIAQAARDYPTVSFLAINPNDAERYPRDSLEAMRERVEREGDWPMPYLRDESQEVARAYGARTTPDVFVVDGEGVLCYRGAPDEDHGAPGMNAGWLREALDSVLAGEAVARPETEPVGCSVKWKP
jgi:peroxiredoxin